MHEWSGSTWRLVTAARRTHDESLSAQSDTSPAASDLDDCDDDLANSSANGCGAAVDGLTVFTPTRLYSGVRRTLTPQ